MFNFHRHRLVFQSSADKKVYQGLVLDEVGFQASLYEPPVTVEFNYQDGAKKDIPIVIGQVAIQECLSIGLVIVGGQSRFIITLNDDTDSDYLTDYLTDAIYWHGNEFCFQFNYGQDERPKYLVILASAQDFEALGEGCISMIEAINRDAEIEKNRAISRYKQEHRQLH